MMSWHNNITIIFGIEQPRAENQPAQGSFPHELPGRAPDLAHSGLVPLTFSVTFPLL